MEIIIYALFALMALQAGLFLWVIVIFKNIAQKREENFEKREQLWQAERKELLDRLMAIDFEKIYLSRHLDAYDKKEIKSGVEEIPDEEDYSSDDYEGKIEDLKILGEVK